jgi:hypothetical protein
VHRFDFEDDTGNDSVGDLEGVLIGEPSFSTDTPAGSRAIVLEGGQYVRIDDDMDFGSEFSLAMWVKPDPSFLGIQNLLANGPGGWDTDGFKLFYNTWSNPSTADGALLLETGDGVNVGLQGESVRSDPGLIVDEEWMHVGATVSIDAVEIRLYLNGELLAAPGGLNVSMKTSSPFEIGRMLNGWDLHGSMDDVQVYQGVLTDDEMMQLFSNPGSAIGLDPSVPGDYTGDGVLNVADIDRQAVAMGEANPDLATFDENSDGAINAADRLILIRDHARTWFGDADLNGVFNSSDFVGVFTAGKYETGGAASWAEGDWDGNLRFDSGDFVAAFTDGGYEAGPRAALHAVPEPTSMFLCLIALSFLAVGRKTSC